MSGATPIVEFCHRNVHQKSRNYNNAEISGCFLCENNTPTKQTYGRRWENVYHFGIVQIPAMHSPKYSRTSRLASSLNAPSHLAIFCCQKITCLLLPLGCQSPINILKVHKSYRRLNTNVKIRFRIKKIPCTE